MPIPKLKPDFTGWDFNNNQTLTMGIMKTKYMIAVTTGLVCFLGLLLTFNQGYTSDTCMFAVTADDLPPNISFLLDNGAEMKHAVTPADYNSSIDYTPDVDTGEKEVVVYGAEGNGFFNETI